MSPEGLAPSVGRVRTGCFSVKLRGHGSGGWIRTTGIRVQSATLLPLNYSRSVSSVRFELTSLRLQRKAITRCAKRTCADQKASASRHYHLFTFHAVFLRPQWELMDLHHRGSKPTTGLQPGTLAIRSNSQKEKPGRIASPGPRSGFGMCTYFSRGPPEYDWAGPLYRRNTTRRDSSRTGRLISFAST